MTHHVTIGLQPGQNNTPTAICVSETEFRQVARSHHEQHYRVRLLETLPAGTRYRAMAERLEEILSGLRHRGLDLCTVNVNATGAGDPLIDFLSRNLTGYTSADAVYFNHGDRKERSAGMITVGKAWLVSYLKVHLQNEQIHLPKAPVFEKLVEELLSYEVVVDERANERYGAFSVGRHDDMIMALGLSLIGKRHLIEGAVR